MVRVHAIQIRCMPRHSTRADPARQRKPRESFGLLPRGRACYQSWVLYSDHSSRSTSSGSPSGRAGALATLAPTALDAGKTSSKETDMMSRTRLLTIVAVASLIAAGCGGSSTDELVIGEYGSLTGSDATFGQSTKKGVEVALDDLMAKQQGKIGGIKVRVVVED